MPVKPIAEPAEAAAVFPEALPVLPVALAAPVRAGHPDPANAPATIAAIEQAARLAQAVDALGDLEYPALIKPNEADGSVGITRDAVVHETSGVTRDRKEIVCEWLNKRFVLLDTGGIDIADQSPLTKAIAVQARDGIGEADLVPAELGQG